MNWLKENWFKLVIAVAVLIALIIYSDDLAEERHAKQERERQLDSCLANAVINYEGNEQEKWKEFCFDRYQQN
jgi:hypothetical protein